MKGVILAAGYGTRFLPATKSIPKEMFPLIDTPAIDLIMKEMAAAGIQDILVVTSRRKKALEDYFDREVELETTFAEEGSHQKLKHIDPIDVNIFFMRQKRMAGTGDALLLVEPFVGDSPFVVAYPDDVQLRGPSLSRQLVDLYEKTGCTVLAGKQVPEGDISRWGVMDVLERDGVLRVKGMVEKPKPGTEPSRIIGYGRYLYTPDLFDALRQTRNQVQAGKEFTQTEAINELARRERVVVQLFEGQMMDVGTKEGFLQSIVEYGLSREEFRDEFLDYMKMVVAREG